MIAHCSSTERRLAAAALALGIFIAGCGGEPARETFASNPAQLSTTTGVAATPNATADTTTTTTIPPLGGDVAAFDDPRFEAVYQCTGTDRDDTYGSQIRYWWDGRMMTTPDMGSDIEREVTEPIWHGDFFYQLRGSVGPAVILDGDPVSMPPRFLRCRRFGEHRRHPHVRQAGDLAASRARPRNRRLGVDCCSLQGGVQTQP